MTASTKKGFMRNAFDAVVNARQRQVSSYVNGALLMLDDDISIDGNRNRIYVRQGEFLDADNDAVVTITGDRNAIGASQDGVFNDAVVTISGNLNELTSRQTSVALGNRFDARVTGNRNTVDVEQVAFLSIAGNEFDLTMTGNRNHLDVVQKNGSAEATTRWLSTSSATGTTKRSVSLPVSRRGRRPGL